MPDDLTIAALQTLSDLKRNGVIPTIRPCCGHDFCICPGAPQPASLRDHAANPAAYDRTIGAQRLHIVTMPRNTGPPPCTHPDPMLCTCTTCSHDRAAAMRNRPTVSQPWEPRQARHAA